MKFKKLLILIIILAVLVVIAVAKKVAVEMGKGEVDGVETEVALNEDLSVGFISEIRIYKGREDDPKGLVLVKNDEDSWIVESRYNARGKKNRIEDLIKESSTLKGEIRSESEEVLGDFSISDSAAVHLLLKGKEGEEIAHILISPKRPSHFQNFVRNSGSARILAVPHDLLSDMGMYDEEAGVNYKVFTDVQTVKVERSKVTRFELRVGRNKALVLTKNEEAEKGKPLWSFDPPDASKEIDTNKVNRCISSVTSVYAVEVLDPEDPSYGFGKGEPLVRIYEKPEDQEPKKTEFYVADHPEEEEMSFVKVLPDGRVYKVRDSYIDPIKKDKKFFLKTKS